MTAQASLCIHSKTSGSITGLLLTLALMLFAMSGTALAKPVVLTIHGGGYVLGGADQMEPTNDLFAALGYEALSIDYTLGNIGAGWRDVRAVAKSYPPRRRIFAFGVSAGGGYAAKLAERGLVDAGYGYSPLVDLTGKWAAAGAYFRCTTDYCQQRFSPVLRSPLSPFRALIPLEDSCVDPGDALGWAVREMKVTAVTYHGEHCSPTSAGYGGDVGAASDWFERKRQDGIGHSADHPALLARLPFGPGYLTPCCWLSGPGPEPGR